MEDSNIDINHKIDIQSSNLNYIGVKVAKPESIATCTTCQQSFKTLKELKSHLLTHESKESYTCLICHKKYYYKTSLSNHLVCHETEIPYKCPFEFCLRTFSTKGNLKVHLKSHGTNKLLHKIETYAIFVGDAFISKKS